MTIGQNIIEDFKPDEYPITDLESNK